MQKIIHINKLKTAQNRTSMFFKHASMIFSSPVKWRVMSTGILGMIFCTIFVTAIFSCGPVSAVSTTESSLETSAGFAVVVSEVNALEIQLSSANLVLNLTPKAEEAVFGSTDLTITIDTSGAAGYNLIMSTSNTNLTSPTNETIDTLAEDEAGYTCTDASCNFTVNHWGFKKSTDTTYNYVPTSVELASNGAPTNGDPTTINFASRVDAAQPAGSYSTTLTFIATVNPTIPSCNPSAATISEAVCLQDLKGDNGLTIANSMTPNEVYSLYDNRDYEQYDVAKLTDGNVWFLDNLRLDPTVITLNSDNSNVTSTPTATFTNKTENWNCDDVQATSCYTEARYNLGSKDVKLSYGPGVTKVGGYYNYCAASAGSYCMDSSSGSGNATQDICPAGWRLPTGGPSSEYVNLANAITGVSGNLSGTDRTKFMDVAHIALTGSFWNAAAVNLDKGGNFWASTLYATNRMHDLGIDATYVYPGDALIRPYGFPVRCILRAGTEMQGATTSTLATKLKNVNDVTTLVDTRDYQPYTVAKLADNKIWMTKNLNLPGGTEIESTKSDVPANYTLPTANGFQSGNKLPATETISSGTTLTNSSAFSGKTTAYVFNSGKTTCSNSSPCYSYYSWTAATAGSGLSIVSEGVDAEYSICPRGWKLPNTAIRTSTNSDTDFRALMIAYGGSSTISDYTNFTSPTGTDMYNRIGTNSIPNFLLTGYYMNGSFTNGGEWGFYASSTSGNSTYINLLLLRFQPTDVYAANDLGRQQGFAIRCLLAE